MVARACMIGSLCAVVMTLIRFDGWSRRRRGGEPAALIVQSHAQRLSSSPSPQGFVLSAWSVHGQALCEDAVALARPTLRTQRRCSNVKVPTRPLDCSGTIGTGSATGGLE